MDLQSESIDNLAARLTDAYCEKEAMRTLARMSGYEDTPPTAQQFLDDDYYMGGVLGDMIYPVWRKGLYEIFPNPFHSPYQEIVIKGCFPYDQKILMGDGSLMEMGEVVRRTLDGEELFVSSYNQETQEVESKKVTGAQKTRSNAKVFKLTLANGKTVRATEDHLFLTTNGWKSLGNLTEEDDLILGDDDDVISKRTS